MDVTQGAAETPDAQHPGKMTVGLHQEYLTAKTREVVTGIAQVRTSVVTENEEISVPVSREFVEVDRIKAKICSCSVSRRCRDQVRKMLRQQMRIIVLFRPQIELNGNAIIIGRKIVKMIRVPDHVAT